MIKPRTHLLTLIFATVAGLLLPISVSAQHDSDSLRTNFYVKGSAGISRGYSIVYDHKKYSLENRWGFTSGVGIDFRAKRHFFIQLGVDYNSVQSYHYAQDETYFPATGVVTYSAINFRHSCWSPYVGISFPVGWNRFYFRPGVTLGATLLTRLHAEDLLDDSKSTWELEGNKRRGASLGMSMLFGYRVNKIMTAWGGYSLSVIAFSARTDTAHPGSPLDENSLAGGFSNLVIALSFNLSQ